MTVETSRWPDEWDSTPISIDGPQGWGSARVAARGQKFCPFWITMLNEDTGSVWDFGKPCSSWTHEPCAVYKAARILRHLADRFSDEHEIWVATATYDSGLGGRMGQRRLEVKTKTGTTVNSCWVRRENDVVWLFATASIGGTDPPETGTFKTPEEAHRLARAALFLPGVRQTKAVNFSVGWRLPKESRPSKGTKMLKRAEYGYAEAIVAEASRRLGVPTFPDLWRNGWLAPYGVDLGKWKATVQAVANTITRP